MTTSDEILKELPSHVKEDGVYYLFGMGRLPGGGWLAGYYPLENWIFEGKTHTEVLEKLKERVDTFEAVKKLMG